MVVNILTTDIEYVKKCYTYVVSLPETKLAAMTFCPKVMTLRQFEEI